MLSNRLVFLARIDTRSIALDLRRDRYLAFNAAMTRGVLDLAGREPTASEADRDRARSRLNALGISINELDPSPPPLAARRTIWASTPDIISMRPAPRPAALLALTETWARLKGQRFWRTLAWADLQLRAYCGDGPLQGVIDDYSATRPWFPIAPICRLDAIATALLLARAGCAPRLVFGVRLDPFHAHCWVEAQGFVINEAAEDVGQYTPILALQGHA
ncbi:lasso peptide biosynthesis B2 protein [Phenylobacterium sp. LjRoot164]|uniref:lasso peptide biosynthesis B2 protein n=1 Tax=unclassified Phenylobacterium TaxID=2640670 RepID=UPI003ECD7537